MKWFTYGQNNSGGYFIDNDTVCEIVVIEAPTADLADQKAEVLFADFGEYCECCGTRWSVGYMSDEDGTPSPEYYGEKLTEIESNYFRTKAILYHADGTVEKIYFKEARK